MSFSCRIQLNCDFRLSNTAELWLLTFKYCWIVTFGCQYSWIVTFGFQTQLNCDFRLLNIAKPTLSALKYRGHGVPPSNNIKWAITFCNLLCSKSVASSCQWKVIVKVRAELKKKIGCPHFFEKDSQAKKLILWNTYALKFPSWIQKCVKSLLTPTGYYRARHRPGEVKLGLTFWPIARDRWGLNWKVTVHEEGSVYHVSTC